MRRGVTLVEISLVCLLASLLMGVVWQLLGGGLRQSSLNIGRTEALMNAMLTLDTLEEDLRNLSLRQKGDLSLFDGEGPGGPLLTFLTGKRAGDGTAGPLIASEEVSWRLEPRDPELAAVVRNGKAVGGARVSRLRFVPKVIDRQGGGRLHFVQTFISAVDSSGKYTLPLMGLTHVALITRDQRHPYWQPNEDQEYRRAGP